MIGEEFITDAAGEPPGPARSPYRTEKIDELLREIESDIRAENKWGNVPQHIPVLAEVNPAQFGICVVTSDGMTFQTGDASTKFSIQSISKVFTLALALEQHGDDIWARIGRSPTTTPYNSATQLENDNGIPRNPFVNAGAIVVSDILLAGHSVEHALQRVLSFIRKQGGDETIDFNPGTVHSEAMSAYRNFYLAHVLRESNNLIHQPEDVLEFYFRHCAIEMNCVQLARAGRLLCSTSAGKALRDRQLVHDINALMMFSGLYQGSGEFAVRVGLPAKGGVGGGILAIVPSVASIAVWSPGLDEYGNSQQGCVALERLSKHTGWSLFNS